MFELLINFIFNVVSTIAQAFMTPVINIIFAMIPDLTVHAEHVFQWFNLAFQYLTCVYRWFLFTPAMFVLLFDYFAIKFTIWVTACGLRFALKLWNTLKP